MVVPFVIASILLWLAVACPTDAFVAQCDNPRLCVFAFVAQCLCGRPIMVIVENIMPLWQEPSWPKK